MWCAGMCCTVVGSQLAEPQEFGGQLEAQFKFQFVGVWCERWGSSSALAIDKIFKFKPGNR